MFPSRLLWLLFALFLVGCATTDSNTQYNEAVWRGQRESLEQLTHWNLAGKLAIITQNQKGSARLTWQQRGDDYDLLLTSLIGTTIMELHRRQGRTEIVDDQGIRHSDSDSEALVYLLTGWPFPIAQLPTWIKGLPGNASYQLAADGRLESLQDQQWQIHYQNYARNRLWLLPTALTLQGPQTTIKLRINEWQIEQ